ncbi:MAG: hypothetical protein KIT22_01625 [Verrucomicrobiae bacterium]|nr:hypothetical protein [Verrucomicrobiae bacterium]
MSVAFPAGRGFGLLLALILAVSHTGCASAPRRAPVSEVRSLQFALVSLAPTVEAGEAEDVARCAYDYPVVLAARYRAVRPALLHNFLVNSGFRERGLCYEWAEDLLAELQIRDLQSLELHWGIAHADTPREHNSIVVTATGRPFEEGIVLDAWRRSGRLVWVPVTADKYPWVEGELTNAPAADSPAAVMP